MSSTEPHAAPRPAPQPPSASALIDARLHEALALARAGQLAAARGLCEAVLDDHPDELTAIRLLVKVLGLSGDAAVAERVAQGAIDRGAGHPGLYFSLGVNRQALGDKSGAIIAYTQAIARDPGHVEARTNLAVLLTDQGGLDAAAEQLDAALRMRPDHVAAWNNLGRVRLARGDAEGAAACHERALAIDPDHANAHNLLACARRAQGRGDEALRHWRRAIALDPRLADAHSNLGGWLLDQGRAAEAEAHLEQALAVEPEHGGALINLANLRELEGRLGEAIALDRRALARDPTDALAHANLGLHLLAAGDFATGWVEREWRLEKPEFRAAARGFGVPRWNGAADPALRLLVHAEQGLGDSIQLVRYLPLARARVGRTILECPAPLAALFERVDGIDEIVVSGAPLPDFDAQIPMPSLPLAFATDLATIPAAVPYIHAEPQRDEAWAARIPDDGALRVGLTWAGNPANANDRRRSMPLETLRPLLGRPGTRFFSLQKGPAAAQAAELPGLVALDPFLRDLADTAAAVARLDLVITVDTSIAHLAGALGRPVWTLLCFAPDWRWMRDRDDSPWYPTMRLFRQASPGAWDAVVERVRVAPPFEMG